MLKGKWWLKDETKRPLSERKAAQKRLNRYLAGRLICESTRGNNRFDKVVINGTYVNDDPDHTKTRKQRVSLGKPYDVKSKAHRNLLKMRAKQEKIREACSAK